MIIGELYCRRGMDFLHNRGMHQPLPVGKQIPSIYSTEKTATRCRASWLLNIGLADASLRTPDLPLITVMCNATGKILQVTDVGRAMVTGKCADIGEFREPILRSLAGRAPYFHNGSAATLMDAVTFYDTRFELHLSQRDKDDLVAFLKTL